MTSKFHPTAAAALALLCAAVFAPAQNKVTQRPEEKSAPEAAAPRQPAAGPERKGAGEADSARYFYEFEQPDFLVSRVRVEHDAAGRGTITFERKSDTEPLVEPLELSAEALRRVSGHWAALNFLDSNAVYQTERQYPHMGTVRLRMRRGVRERTAEFNHSADPDAAALASEYRRAADQAIFVFEIRLAQESQPLEAPKLLSRLEAMVARKWLSDARQLLPLLRELSTDERLPLIARNHAGRLLKKLEKE